jgi:hypothetical protein
MTMNMNAAQSEMRIVPKDEEIRRKRDGTWDAKTMLSSTSGEGAARLAAMNIKSATPMPAPVKSEIDLTRPQRPDSSSFSAAQIPHLEAVALLSKLAPPEGPWTVRTISSIEPGPPKIPRKLGYSVGPQNVDDLVNGIAGWISAAAAGRHNCYFHVAVAKPTAIDKAKLLKDDLVGASAVWTDVDAGDVDHPVLDEKDFAMRRAAILSALKAQDPPFSCIVDSGNGYQAYKFIQFHSFCDSTAITALEAANKAISASVNKRLEGTGLSADTCHSADHLMRLPGSTNFLTAKKRSFGYPEGDRPARIVDWHPERVYKLEDLPTLLESDGKSIRRQPDRTDTLSDGTESIAEDQLKELLTGLDPRNFRDGPRWRALLWSCHAGTRGKECQVFVDWSASDPEFSDQQDNTRTVWERAKDDRENGVTIATLLHELKQAGSGDLVHSLRRQLNGRPHILFDETKLSEILDRVEAELIAASAPIYQTGGRIVHPIRLDMASDEEGVCRSAGALLLRNIPALRFREYFLSHLAFRRLVTAKNGKQVEVPCAPPVSLANHSLSREDMWRVPVISGISETPTLRADGSLLDCEGFDKTSGLLIDFNGAEFPQIPDFPTREQAVACLEMLKQLLVGFPFVPDDGNKPELSASRSVALSAILTALVRRAMRSAPMHAFSAPTMGTGKTLLCDVVSMIGAGRLATAMSQGHNETEDEKRLLGVLMRGDLMLVIDNVHRPICGDTLCTILTQQTWQGRLLGENRQVHVPTNVLIIATGNNLAVAGDMTTRTLIGRLDAGIERPETRRFDIDLKTEIPRRRPEIVAAGLTVLRAFVTAGRPGLHQLEPFGRFEDWSNLVRGALIWLGEPDPCGTRSYIVERDPVRSELGALVAAWLSSIEEGRLVTSNEVIRASADRKHDALAQALTAILPKGVTAKGLTDYLSEYDGRIVDGRCIRKHYDRHAKVSKFRLDTAAERQVQAEIPF